MQVMFNSREISIVLAVILIISFGLSVVSAETLSENMPNRTSLLVLTTISGDYDSDGGMFIIRVTVKNIGDYTSEDTKIILRNIPAGWILTPATDGNKYSLGDVLPGEEIIREFEVVRDSKEASIYVTAGSDNSPQVSSEIIPVPIHPMVISSFIFFALLAFSRYRKNR